MPRRRSERMVKSLYERDLNNNEIYPVDELGQTYYLTNSENNMIYAKNNLDDEYPLTNANQQITYAIFHTGGIKYPVTHSGSFIFEKDHLQADTYIKDPITLAEIYPRLASGDEIYLSIPGVGDKIAVDKNSKKIFAFFSNGTVRYPKDAKGETIFGQNANNELVYLKDKLLDDNYPIDSFGNQFYLERPGKNYIFAQKSNGDPYYAVNSFQDQLYPGGQELIAAGQYAFSHSGRVIYQRDINNAIIFPNDGYITLNNIEYYPFDSNNDDVIKRNNNNEPVYAMNYITNEIIYPSTNAGEIIFNRNAEGKPIYLRTGDDDTYPRKGQKQIYLTDSSGTEIYAKTKDNDDIVIVDSVPIYACTKDKEPYYPLSKHDEPFYGADLNHKQYYILTKQGEVGIIGSYAKLNSNGDTYYPRKDPKNINTEFYLKDALDNEFYGTLANNDQFYIHSKVYAVDFEFNEQYAILSSKKINYLDAYAKSNESSEFYMRDEFNDEKYLKDLETGDEYCASLDPLGPYYAVDHSGCQIYPERSNGDQFYRRSVQGHEAFAINEKRQEYYALKADKIQQIYPLNSHNVEEYIIELDRVVYANGADGLPRYALNAAKSEYYRGSTYLKRNNVQIYAVDESKNQIYLRWNCGDVYALDSKGIGYYAKKYSNEFYYGIDNTLQEYYCKDGSSNDVYIENTGQVYARRKNPYARTEKGDFIYALNSQKQPYYAKNFENTGEIYKLDSDGHETYISREIDTNKTYQIYAQTKNGQIYAKNKHFDEFYALDKNLETYYALSSKNFEFYAQKKSICFFRKDRDENEQYITKFETSPYFLKQPKYASDKLGNQFYYKDDNTELYHSDINTIYAIKENNSFYAKNSLLDEIYPTNFTHYRTDYLNDNVYAFRNENGFRIQYYASLNGTSIFAQTNTKEFFYAKNQNSEIYGYKTENGKTYQYSLVDRYAKNSNGDSYYPLDFDLNEYVIPSLGYANTKQGYIYPCSADGYYIVQQEAQIPKFINSNTTITDKNIAHRILQINDYNFLTNVQNKNRQLTERNYKLFDLIKDKCQHNNDPSVTLYLCYFIISLLLVLLGLQWMSSRSN